MFCPFCGTELPDDSKFCSGCGSRVDLEDEVQMPDLSVMPEMPEDPRPQKSGKGKIIAVIVAVIVVLAAAGVGGYFIYNHIQEGKEEERLEAEEKEAKDEEEAGTGKEKAEDAEDEDADTEDADAKDADSKDADDAKEEEKITVEEKYDPTEGGIHQYEYIVADVSWDQAYADCKSRGGYLVHINSREEYDYILNEISQKQLNNIQFFLGGRRTSGSQEYYWIDEDGNAYGDQINVPGYWCASEWLSGEPSFMDGSIEEMYLDMFYHQNSGKWVWNDAPNDILSIVPSFSGKIGYICEYDN